MAKKKVYVSKHGLTSCPTCSAHIRVEDEVAATECPFCGASLTSGGGVLAGIRNAVSHGRSGLVAASLLGLTTLAGCGDDEDDPATDMAEDTVEDTVDDGSDDMGGDTGDDMAGDATDMEVTDALPDAPVPEYGLPADMLDIEDAVNDTPVPEYGLPADATD